MAGLDVSRFPREFRWGVATAAYQIEGAAREGGRGPSIWDTFTHTPGLSFHGDTGDVACDHYHRWEADLDLMVSLGIRDYRLSLSWSRLQPTGVGPLNEEGVAFYERVLSGMRARGIRPLVTLYHWDLPQPLEDAGGWPVRDTAVRFAAFVRSAVERLGALCEDWVTLNEPWCSSILGYGKGAHAPGRKDLRDAVAAAHHLNLAHGLALAEIRDVAPAARVGTTNIVTDILPASDSPADLAAARRLDATSNRLFLDPVYTARYSDLVLETLAPYGLTDWIQPGDLELIGRITDFAGINHYQRVLASDDPSQPFGVRETAAEPATTSFGWSVIPASLTAVLTRVAREFTTLPLYVTENGAMSTRPARCATLSASTISMAISPPPRTRSRPGSTCGGTTRGRSSTTSSGPRATASGSGSSTSTTRRRPASRSSARTGIATGSPSIAATDFPFLCNVRAAPR
jgi:beta-glucosidase